MAFSEETKKQAWRRAGGKCEKYGTDLSGQSWHAHHKQSLESDGHDGLSNCQVLCLDCHKDTKTYGG